jgi:hypothetical protein
MGVLSDATFLHMEVTVAIDNIDEALRQARREREDPARFREHLEAILPQAEEIRSRLEVFYRREREELFPRALRIFGTEIDEVRELVWLQISTLSTLDQFIEELQKRLQRPSPPHPVRLAYLDLLFQEFTQVFERRRDAESLFYQTCSTLLYPGGLTAD